MKLAMPCLRRLVIVKAWVRFQARPCWFVMDKVAVELWFPVPV
jgi:hypothetical protein